MTFRASAHSQNRIGVLAVEEPPLPARVDDNALEPQPVDAAVRFGQLPGIERAHRAQAEQLIGKAGDVGGHPIIDLLREIRCWLGEGFAISGEEHGIAQQPFRHARRRADPDLLLDIERVCVKDHRDPLQRCQEVPPAALDDSARQLRFESCRHAVRVDVHNLVHKPFLLCVTVTSVPPYFQPAVAASGDGPGMPSDLRRNTRCVVPGSGWQTHRRPPRARLT